MLEKGVQIWVFLDKYGTYIFNSDLFKDEYFPKNEILLTDSIVEVIKKTKKVEQYSKNPLNAVKLSNVSIFEAIRNLVRKNYKAYVLDENGTDFRSIFSGLSSKDKLLFILGDQSGDLLNNQELKKLNLTNLSFGNRSYLASSTIRLIKMNLQLFI
jgi:tRNA pseudouridine-54 N-methylase